jgi:hypothetical protein
MPQDIENQIWEYAPSGWLSQRILAASRQPLRVVEARRVFATDFNPESTPTSLADWCLEGPSHVVLSACSSLISIPEGDFGVIQFSHFSVKEFLTSESPVRVMAKSITADDLFLEFSEGPPLYALVYDKTSLILTSL